MNESILVDDDLASLTEPDKHDAGGELILARLQTLAETAIGHDPAPVAMVAAAGAPAAAAYGQSWRVTFRLPEKALGPSANPLLLLDALRELGNCEIVVLTDAVPPLDAIDPEVCYLGWDVVLTTDRPRQAIDDVFMLLRDDMELSIEAVAVPQ